MSTEDQDHLQAASECVAVADEAMRKAVRHLLSVRATSFDCDAATRYYSTALRRIQMLSKVLRKAVGK